MHVVVIGGGTAGIGAAAGAAAGGARVTLIERLGFLGGMATAAQVGTLCGLFLRSKDAPGTWAVGGFARTFAERLAALDNQEVVCWREGLQFLPYAPFSLRSLADDVLREHGVQPWFHSTLFGGRARPEGGFSLDVLTWDRPASLEADAVVDTSGTAIGATLLGARTIEDPVHQAAAYVFGLSGLREAPSLGLKLALMRGIRHGLQRAALPDMARRISIVPGSHVSDRVLLKLGLGGGLPDDPHALSALESDARRVSQRVCQVLRELEEVFSNAQVYDPSAQVGVRTGRRVWGRRVLTREEVLEARADDEGIALAAWPIELWHEADQPTMGFPPLDRACQVPAGCLESVDVPGLFAAGRCLSATTDAIAAARVIGTCLATGYAAGRLAACHAMGGDRASVIAELRAQQLTSLPAS